MIVSLNDPESVLRWWKVFPERHDAFLEFKLKVSPQFAPAIREVQRRIAASPELSALLVRSVQGRRDQQAAAVQDHLDMSAYELRREGFA